MSQSTSPLSKKKWTAEDIPDQSGKVHIITGANSGIGLEVSLQLAGKNAMVVMACRNMVKAEEAAAGIKKEHPDANLDLMELDLSSFDSIEKFAEDFKEKYNRLDGLLNNAGIMQPPKRETEQGYELQFGVNHLGHFLLTSELLEPLKQTEGSRVINQSSIAHRFGKIRFDDINWEEDYSRTDAYGQSKLANLLFTYELHRKIQNKNLDIRSVGVHPGYTATNLQHNGPTVGGKSFLSRIYSVSNKLLAQKVSKGALPLLYAATADDVESGDFIGPGGIWGIRGYPRRIKSSKSSYDEDDAARLWKISEQLIGKNFEL